MRWLTILAALAGVAAGLAWPTSGSRAGTGYWYETAMAPPPTYSGVNVTLTCGWHTGACDQWGENGPNLDWDDIPQDQGVQFRGWFTRSSSPSESNRLFIRIFQYQYGSDVCDELVGDVYERYNNTLRYGMHYLHSSYVTTGDRNLYTSTNHEYNSILIGQMTWDIGCTGQWYHVHEFWASVSVPTPVKNTTDIDHYGIYSPLESYPNNATWTRWRNWEEGS